MLKTSRYAEHVSDARQSVGTPKERLVRLARNIKTSDYNYRLEMPPYSSGICFLRA
jgi:hypothetical protein